MRRGLELGHLTFEGGALFADAFELVALLTDAVVRGLSVEETGRRKKGNGKWEKGGKGQKGSNDQQLAKRAPSPLPTRPFPPYSHVPFP
ncbi:MAG: hypothetical protein ACREOK_09670 [Gemmatimonadaceae bacterium]